MDFLKDKESSNRLSFRSKNPNNSDLYGSLIPEGIEIGINELGEIALENAKAFAPDAKIIKKEYRMVMVRRFCIGVEATAKSLISMWDITVQTKWIVISRLLWFQCITWILRLKNF